MLLALRHPVIFGVLVVSFLIALAVRWAAQRGAMAAMDRRPRWARRQRGDVSIKQFVDPYGAVGALLAGVGWGSELPEEADARTRRGRFAVATLAGPGAMLGLAVLGLLAFRLAGGDPTVLGAVTLSDVLQGSTRGIPAAQAGLLAFAATNLALGVLAVVPIPPLDGGRLLFALAPRTIGWQRAEHRLREQNWGIVALLALLLLPLSRSGPLLLVALDAVCGPLLRLGA